MQQLAEDLKFDRDAPALQLRALNVLHAFHSLRFPEQYLDDPVLRIVELDDKVAADYGWEAGQVLLKPEVELLAHQAEPDYISAAIRPSARPILDFLARTRPNKDLHEAMVEYTQRQKARYYHGERHALADNHGRRLPARKILPPPEVTKAMHDSWNVRGLRYCRPLERYIGEVVARII